MLMFHLSFSWCIHHNYKICHLRCHLRLFSYHEKVHGHFMKYHFKTYTFLWSILPMLTEPWQTSTSESFSSTQWQTLYGSSLLVYASVPVIPQSHGCRQTLHGSVADWYIWVTIQCFNYYYQPYMVHGANCYICVNYQNLLMISPCMVHGFIGPSDLLTSRFWWSAPAWYRGLLVYLSY